MSAAWSRGLCSLWSVICDSRATETTFKRKAGAKRPGLTSPKTPAKKLWIRGRERNTVRENKCEQEGEKRNLYGNPKRLQTGGGCMNTKT